MVPTLAGDQPSIQLRKGQKVAITKLCLGTVLVTGGVISGTIGGGVVAAGGIIILKRRTVQAYIEWGLGGDTSNVPDWWWELWLEIFMKIIDPCN